MTTVSIKRFIGKEINQEEHEGHEGFFFNLHGLHALHG
jgi:hypothetical protein